MICDNIEARKYDETRLVLWVCVTPLIRRPQTQAHKASFVMPKCNKCHRNLPLSGFSKDRTRPLGYRKICKKCCAAGSSMNCEDYRVVEFWERHIGKGSDWEFHRNPEFEVELEGAR